MLSFFGLTPQYRNTLFTQVHDLVYHGGGGFIHSEVYNMPTWMRKFHILRINKHVKEKNEEMEKAQKQANPNPNKSIQRPNVKPSSTYNFKK